MPHEPAALHAGGDGLTALLSATRAQPPPCLSHAAEEPRTLGHDGAPPHCHSADEELFVFLDRGATFELWPSPPNVPEGAEGVTFLVYGTRRPNDVCYYPRSNKIYWRGLGFIARVGALRYDDGEPED